MNALAVLGAAAALPPPGAVEALRALVTDDDATPIDDAQASLVEAEPGQIDVGLVQLCGRELAVPAESVREVVPLPAKLQPSFSGADISPGSIVIRGRVIPVLDIAGQLGFGAREGGGGVVLILRHAQALIGIVMDSVSGLARIARESIQPFAVNTAGDHRIVSSTFPHGDALVGLIDPAAVLALPGVPHAAEQRAAPEAAGAGGRSAVVLVTVAGANIALDAALVVATVPNALLRPSPAPSSKWVSVVEYLGQEVPVVDDLALFGLSGRASDLPGGAVIILRLDAKRLLGLKIDRVQRILPITERSIRPLPQALAEQLTLFRGAIVDHEGRQNLLLDGDALTNSDPLRMIGALSREAAAPARGAVAGPATAEDRQPYLVFVAGDRRRAAALASVKQIIPFPEARTGLNREGSGLQGIASYNGAPLPLLDLAGNGMGGDRPDAVVLVVEKDGGFNGLVVDKLETLSRSAVHRRPGMNGDDAASFFIDAKLGDRSEAVTLCDLAEEAVRLA
ncbi:chemotaxis protein CheW [Sphingomonas sp. HF-S4]|uniref:Chemotaxis protein CheW n=1 Tax=Sphingomonas agrestis TaxID=3080540 RepID=A0ABU3Y3S0_9SPHN|nr:chemotaxis protein CheW [Sphingomonas sp. HF-S4]MDV3456034.1 chemotaxis protein CheW [Sphingomonas sp. HF-S4]